MTSKSNIIIINGHWYMLLPTLIVKHESEQVMVQERRVVGEKVILKHSTVKH